MNASFLSSIITYILSYLVMLGFCKILGGVLAAFGIVGGTAAVIMFVSVMVICLSPAYQKVMRAVYVVIYNALSGRRAAY